jgi:polygalacturonase
MSLTSLPRLVALLFVLLSALVASGAVRCPPVFGSGMVLQRDLPVPVWGTAAPGERVVVEFADQQAVATADAQGRWAVRLTPLAASSAPRTLVVRGTNELRFEDVLVGEVWLCSGQSNMEKPLGVRSGQHPTDNAEAEIRAANHPQIRLFQVPRNGRPAKDDLTLQWHVCRPDTIDRLSFSAAAYFFGRELQQTLGVPIGLLHTSYGGTRIEPWTLPEAYAPLPGASVLAEAAAGNRRIDGSDIGGLYRTMVDPLAPYAVRGFLWYQGESNLVAGDIAAYPLKMRALIEGWRTAWQRADAPFYFVQLAPYLYSARNQPRPLTASALPLFWEAQARVLADRQTGLAVITDTVADLRDIHPTNKRDVGLRLARLALARTYGRSDVVDSGPIKQAVTFDDSLARVAFTHATGLRSRDGQALTGFELAGADQAFHPASAQLVGESVELRSPEVSKPVAVRFAWHERANPNLVNAAGLPARSFRTDDWPVALFRDAAPADAPAMRLPDVALPVIPATTVRLVDFGAVPDGRTLNTAAFTAAIAALVERGGGRLIVPAGEWLTGPIVLRSKVELHLEKDAFIRFSADRELYPLVESDYEGRPEWRCQSPLSGVNLEDVAITGEGIIDGAGEAWRPVKKSKQTPEQWAALIARGGVLNARGDIWYPSEGSRQGNEQTTPRLTRDPATRAAIKDALRPVLLSLRNCKRVLLQGVTFRNSPSWCIHPLFSEDLTVRGITVLNPWWAQNGDGIDLDSCRSVLVENSTFDVGDDAICLKSGRDAEGRARRRPTENVTIRGCTVRHGHGGFVIGSEMSSGVRNVRVSDCTFIGTDLGLRFKSTRGRGGVVQDILVERVRMEKIARDAITFDLFYGGKAPTETTPDEDSAPTGERIPPVSETTPAFRNIVLRGITVVGAQRAALLQGLPEMPLDTLRLEDSSFTTEQGFVLHDVDLVTFENVSLQMTRGPALDLRGVRHLHVQEFRSPTLDGPTVRLAGARSAEITLPWSVPESAISRSADAPLDAVLRPAK